jgi:hypothetical protein
VPNDGKRSRAVVSERTKCDHRGEKFLVVALYGRAVRIVAVKDLHRAFSSRCARSTWRRTAQSRIACRTI